MWALPASGFGPYGRAPFGVDDHLFVLRRRPPTARTVQRRLARYTVQAGVQATAHGLRHALATRLVNQGMPIHSLRKLFVRQYLNTTQV